MQLASLCNLHRDVLAQNFLRALHKGPTHVAAVAQQALHLLEPALATLQCLQRSFAIGHLGRGHGYCMWQTLRIHCNVAFDARDFLACVIALEGRCVRVLHALRVHDQVRAACVAPLFLSGRANLIF